MLQFEFVIATTEIMLKLGNYLLKSNNLICHRLLNNGLSNGLNIVRNETGCYDGDGKTSIQVMNKDLEFGLMIEAYNEVCENLFFFFFA